ncbi:reverse transcriptase [Gossypium australe]|uniref:Reverse transcriptase n=1 Tax=Gossypium australe TaxID=47621 RepID=A0A5B6V944_9ROSI|nr:reverse transcriptase [Gossypium australe]
MRTTPTKAASVSNLDVVTRLSNQLEMMNKKIGVMQYDSNLGGVANLEYPPYRYGMENEQVRYMGYYPRLQNNFYGNTYNASWSYHPNFSWDDQNSQRLELPPNFQQPPHQQEEESHLEEMLTKFSADTEKRIQETERTIKSNESRIVEITKSVKEVTNAVEQLAKLMSEQPQGRLPSNTKINPKEQNQAITDQDNKGLDEPNKEVDEGKIEVTQEKPKLVIKEYQPRIPYPEAMKRDDSEEQFDARLEEIFKTTLDKQTQIRRGAPRGIKSSMLSNVTEQTTAVAKRHRKFYNSILSIDNALADLGVSINVMPYKMFKQLGLGKPRQTRMSIQLTDKTIRIPRGIIENVLIKIDKFIFPVDFGVLDMNEDNSIPLILGRPFLATARFKIDVGTGELILRVGDESISLQAFDSARTSSDECEKVNSVDNQIIQLSPQETPQGYKPDELLVESDPRQEPVVSEGKVEVSHDLPNPVNTEYQARVPYPDAIKKDHTEEEFGELTLRVDNETVTLQALELARISSNKGTNINSIDNHLVQPSLQEASRNHLDELDLRPRANKEETHKEQSLRIDKLKEQKTQIREEQEPHEVKPKEIPDKLIGTTNHIKIEDQVLLNKEDPRITNSDLKANE